MNHPFAVFIPLGGIPIDALLVIVAPANRVAVNDETYFNPPRRG